MSWNQGNGYGQQEDVYGRLNNTKEIGGARFPFLEDSGKYALCTLEEFSHSVDGPSARALFEVLESKTGKHPVGGHVVKIWKLVKPPHKPGMTTDADMFADFCRKLKGAPVGYPIGNDIRALMKERSAEQLARGTVIETSAVPKEYTKRDGTKGLWTNIYWLTVQQSPQDIAAMRQRLEQKGIPSTKDGVPSQQAPQQAVPGYGPSPHQQIQGAPNPSYYPTQTQPAPATPAAAPQGGFLAQIPPQNTGNGGNNGGGGAW